MPRQHCQRQAADVQIRLSLARWKYVRRPATFRLEGHQNLPVHLLQKVHAAQHVFKPRVIAKRIEVGQ
jgi:hypothetical protein